MTKKGRYIPKHLRKVLQGIAKMRCVSETFTIWRGETMRVLRSRRFVALLVLFLMAEGLSLVVVNFFTAKLHTQFDAMVNSMEMDAAQVQDYMLHEKKAVLKNFFFSSSDERTLKELASLPLMLLIVFSLTKFFAPLLIALMGFDQLSGELGPLSIRYLVVRAHRDNIILGKFFAQCTTLAILLFLCVLLMTSASYVIAATDFHIASAIKWGFRLTAVMVIVGATYGAFTTLCSSLTRVNSHALFRNIIGLILFLFLRFMGNIWAIPGHRTSNDVDLVSTSASMLGMLRYLTPAEFAQALLSAAPSELAIGLAAHAGFTFIFLGAAQLIMRRRDV